MFYIFVMLTRASFSFQMGKVSGAAELGVERVHVHVHILIGKESKYVPLFDFVLKCARATDFQTFYRPWEFYFKKHSTQLLFITNPELLISITEVLMSIESCWTICVFSCIVKKLYPKLPLTNCLLIDINYLLPAFSVFSDLDVIDWKNRAGY